MPRTATDPESRRVRDPDATRGRRPPPATIVYPESDGKPMSDNTRQYEYIVTIKEGIEALFPDSNVAVFGNLLWYPTEGDARTRAAPDVMVAFGRPKGHRGSYRQWEEGGIAPQVVFEVLSPSNRPAEMARKHAFYQRHGVLEYYVYDPDHETLAGYLREAGRLAPIPEMNGWTSPRLGIRFVPTPTGLELHRPDGRRFETFQEVVCRADLAQRRADDAQRRADDAQRRADELQRRLDQVLRDEAKPR